MTVFCGWLLVAFVIWVAADLLIVGSLFLLAALAGQR